MTLAPVTGTPRGAGIPGKKKGPEIIRALVYGGAGGNRTPVRKSSTVSSTYLADLFGFNPGFSQSASRPRASYLEFRAGPSNPIHC